MLRRVRIGPSLALISLFVIAVIGVWLTLSHVAPHQETDQAAEATNLQLRRLNYRRDTLEDIFLKAMEVPNGRL